MSDQPILLVKRGSISATHRTALRKAGIVVAECHSLLDVKFLTQPIGHVDVRAQLWAAMDAIERSQFSDVREKFAYNISKMTTKSSSDLKPEGIK